MRNKKTRWFDFFALIESMIIKDDKNKFKHLLTTVTDISEQKNMKKAGNIFA